MTKGDKDYDIFVEGGLPKAIPGVDAPTQLEKKIAGAIREAEGDVGAPRFRPTSLLSPAE